MKTSFTTPCSCGEAHVTTYAKKLRANMLPALRLLCEARRPMTAIELAGFFPEPLRTEIKRHFASLRLWRLIEKDGQTYRPSIHGMHFVAGRSTAPMYVFTRNNVLVERPEDAPEPTYVAFDDLCPPPVAKEMPERATAIKTRILTT